MPNTRVLWTSKVICEFLDEIQGTGLTFTLCMTYRMYFLKNSYPDFCRWKYLNWRNGKAYEESFTSVPQLWNVFLFVCHLDYWSVNILGTLKSNFLYFLYYFFFYNTQIQTFGWILNEYFKIWVLISSVEQWRIITVRNFLTVLKSSLSTLLSCSAVLIRYTIC